MDIRLSDAEARRLKELRRDTGCESPTAVVRALLSLKGEARGAAVELLKGPDGLQNLKNFLTGEK